MSSFSTVDVVLATVIIGDMIEFDRGRYSHYALYVGSDQVMNICAEEENSTKAFVCKLPLQQVCGTSRARISNHEDIARTHFESKPQPIEEILRNAQRDEERFVPYRNLLENSEYYVSKWRYGRGFSTQVADMLESWAKNLAEAMSGGVFDRHQLTFNFDPYAEYKQITPN